MQDEWKKKVEERLLKYMDVESTTGSEEAFADVVVEDLQTAGYKVVKQPISDTSSRFNILATFGNATKEDVTVLFNTHLDTVPPHFPPTQDKKNIYGRGSNDAKGQIACMVSAAIIMAASDVKLATRVGLLFVVGEEVDHVGMQAANALGLRPTHLVVGEPTELMFATIQKGALKIRLIANGVAGHSGYPDSGTSAIHTLVNVLSDVMAYKWPQDERYGDTTFNIGKISGGQALNAWAENAQAVIFFRITTSVADVREQLEKVVNGRVELESLNFNDPVLLDEAPFSAPITQAAFNTDLPFYDYRHELKGRYLFGAGSIRNAHSKDEFVPKEELHQCTDTLIRLVNQVVRSE